jgi:hypothetical protein
MRGFRFISLMVAVHFAFWLFSLDFIWKLYTPLDKRQDSLRTKLKRVAVCSGIFAISIFTLITRKAYVEHQVNQLVWRPEASVIDVITRKFWGQPKLSSFSLSNEMKFRQSSSFYTWKPAGKRLWFLIDRKGHFPNETLFQNVMNGIKVRI